MEKEAKNLDKKERKKEKVDDKSEKKERKDKAAALDQEISRKNQIEIKQRVASYSMKAFDLLDLKKIILHWKCNI
jgi:ribosomal protein L9